MNAHKKNTWLKRQRDWDLFDSYRHALVEHSFRSQREAVDHVRQSPAPRFYISAHAAMSYINVLLSGRELKGLNKSSLRRITEIYRRFSEMCCHPSNVGRSRYSICQEIVEQPAPEFYIGYELASKVICRETVAHNDRVARRSRI